jgi:hypothetical protein
MRFFLFASAFVLACAGVAPAADLNPGAPILPIPSFTLAIPGYATWAGTLSAQNAPAGPVKCPVTVMYNAKITITSLTNNVVAGAISYSWAPSKALPGFYEVSNADPGAAFGGAPELVTAAITYEASSPSEGSPVTFTATVSGANAPTKEILRVVSHIKCTNVRVLR